MNYKMFKEAGLQEGDIWGSCIYIIESKINFHGSLIHHVTPSIICSPPSPIPQRSFIDLTSCLTVNTGRIRKPDVIISPPK